MLSDLREQAKSDPDAGPVLKATADMIANIERDVLQMMAARAVPPLPDVDGTLTKLAQIATDLAERGAEELRQAREEFHRRAQEWARQTGHAWNRPD